MHHPGKNAVKPTIRIEREQHMQTTIYPVTIEEKTNRAAGNARTRGLTDIGLARDAKTGGLL